MKQPDKMTAYYYSAAQTHNDLHLDNKIQRILYHARENGRTALAAKVGERR